MFLGSTADDLCPVAAIAADLAIRGKDPGPFFRFLTGSPLSRELLVRQVRLALKREGVDDS